MLGPAHSFSATTILWFRSHHLPCIGPKTGRSTTVVQPPLAPVPCLLVVAGIPIASISLVRAAEFLVCLTPKPTSKLLTVGFLVPTSSIYLSPYGSLPLCSLTTTFRAFGSAAQLLTPISTSQTASRGLSTFPFSLSFSFHPLATWPFDEARCDLLPIRCFPLALDPAAIHHAAEL